ncbi:hypothetical protein ACH5BK_02550 [Arcobacter sp. YIC-80]|uniref:hypothetical protein n=1 Tax=Arcobacter sp. YIC-80 TaxID=3376683 RepID=UPI00385180B6
MEVSFDKTKTISYNAAGQEVVEEKNPTNSTFAKDLEKTKNTSEITNEYNEEKKEEDIADKLLKDIMSLFKTGLTVEELEMIQKLLEEIKKKVSESKPPLSSDEIKEIDSMMEKLERMIKELQKRAKGEAVIDMENSHVNNISKEDKSDTSKSISLDIAGFQKRIQKAQNDIDELNKTINEAQVNELRKNHEELELLQALKQ